MLNVTADAPAKQLALPVLDCSLHLINQMSTKRDIFSLIIKYNQTVIHHKNIHYDQIILLCICFNSGLNLTKTSHICPHGSHAIWKSMESFFYNVRIRMEHERGVFFPIMYKRCIHLSIHIYPYKPSMHQV